MARGRRFKSGQPDETSRRSFLLDDRHGAARAPQAAMPPTSSLLADPVGPALVDVLNDDTVGALVKLRAAIAILDRPRHYSKGENWLAINAPIRAITPRGFGPLVAMRPHLSRRR